MSEGTKKQFRESLKIGRRLGLVLLWEVLLIIGIIAGAMIFMKAMTALTPMMTKMTEPFTTQNAFKQQLLMGGAEETASKLMKLTITYTVLGLLYLFGITVFFKAKTYLTIWDKKLTGNFYLRYAGMLLIWMLGAGVLTYLVQFAVYNTIYDKVIYSAKAKAGVVIIGIVFLQLMIYLTITLFSIFTEERRIWRGLVTWYKTAIVKIGKFLIPMGVVFLMFIVLNVLLLVTRLLYFDVLVLLISTAWVTIYTAWTKIYYTIVIDNLIGKTPKTVGGKIKKHKRQEKITRTRSKRK